MLILRSFYCIIVLISLTDTIFAALNYQYSDAPIQINISKKFNHINLKGANLNQVIGPQSNFRLIATTGNSFTLIPQIEHGKLTIALACDNGLSQDLILNISNIQPQKINLDMSLKSEKHEVKTLTQEQIFSKNFLSYVASIGKRLVKSAKAQHFTDYRLNFGEEYFCFDAAKNIKYIVYEIKVSNKEKRVLNPYRDLNFASSDEVVAMYFDDSLIAEKDSSFGYILVKGVSNIFGEKK